MGKKKERKARWDDGKKEQHAKLKADGPCRRRY